MLNMNLTSSTNLTTAHWRHNTVILVTHTKASRYEKDIGMIAYIAQPWSHLSELCHDKPAFRTVWDAVAPAFAAAMHPGGALSGSLGTKPNAGQRSAKNHKAPQHKPGLINYTLFDAVHVHHAPHSQPSQQLHLLFRYDTAFFRYRATFWCRWVDI